MKTAILVLGVHRSGTSALTKLINLMGAALPKTLYAPNKDNPLGYWESEVLMKVNDRVLGRAGGRWDAMRPIGRGWFRDVGIDDLREELRRAIESEFEGGGLVVIKDPRICQLVPFYEGVLFSMGYETKAVIPTRHPAEVIESLVRRKTPPDVARQIWLRGIFAVDRDTRAMSRVWTTYEELLGDWGSVEKKVRTLGEFPSRSESLASEVANSVKKEFRRSVGGRADRYLLRVWDAVRMPEGQLKEEMRRLREEAGSNYWEA